MGVDYYCRMGSTHAICQDYVLAGESDGLQYAVLSDGCSGSPKPGDPGSPHTDFGSRFLVHSARRHLQDMTEGTFPGDAIITQAQGMARQTYLGIDSLYATMIAGILKNQVLQTYHTGDGVIACRTREGVITYTTKQFDNNAPHYLAYAVSPKDHDRYLEQVKQVTVRQRSWRPDSGWGDPSITVEPVDRHLFHTHSVFSAGSVDLVLIMSDGAESFVRKANNEPVPLEKVLEQLFAIKNFKGEFLTRRCNAFLHRFCAEQGWVHEDDFSVAGFYFGE